jgi:hypothetical protein
MVNNLNNQGSFDSLISEGIAIKSKIDDLIKENEENRYPNNTIEWNEKCLNFLNKIIKSETLIYRFKKKDNLINELIHKDGIFKGEIIALFETSYKGCLKGCAPSDISNVIADKIDILVNLKKETLIKNNKKYNKITLIKEDTQCVLKYQDKELKVSYSSPGGQSLQSILLIKIFSKPREYRVNTQVSWDELNEADDIADDYKRKKEQTKNAIYALNQKSNDKLKKKLFNWNNGDIKILE